MLALWVLFTHRLREVLTAPHPSSTQPCQQVDARGVNSVSQALFNEYYRDVSSCVPDDAFFEALLEGCWPAATRVLQGGGISTARDAITRAPGAVDSGARGPPSIFDDFSVSKGSGLDSVTASAALRKRLSAVSDLGACCSCLNAPPPLHTHTPLAPH